VEKEFYITGKKLIPREEWERKICSIRSSVIEDLQDKEKAKAALTNQLLRAVKERLPDEPFAVLFSGGVDSSLVALLAKRAGKDFACYTLGFQDDDSKEPEDMACATMAAKELGLKIKIIMVDLKKAEELIKNTASILGPGLNNVVNIGVGGVVLGCVEAAKKDGIRYFFSGLGSEELFAGYQRHKLAEDKQEECWQGLISMYERDLLRDFAVSSATKTHLLTPFLDEQLIATAMRVPDKFKIDNKGSKLILREIAEDLRLPKDIAWRGKRAAQYGSRLDKAIDRLARKNGFKQKKDYLQSLN
jgi:asparagine synthetase B (glutamine-hydrolysing)